MSPAKKKQDNGNVDSNNRQNSVSTNVESSYLNPMVVKRNGSVGGPVSPEESSKFFENKDLSSITFHQVARDGNIALMEKLINYHRTTLHYSKKKKINAKDEDDLTPLHYAAKHHQYPMIKYLIDNGADAKLKGEDEATVLHFLAKYKKKRLETQLGDDEDDEEIDEALKSCIRLLLENGTDVNARDAMGFTPLHQACSRNNIKVVRILVQYKAVDLEVSDQQGLTALHFSCLFGRPKIVKILLDCGAVIRCRDKDLTTPFHLCCAEGSLEVARLLIAKANSLAQHDSIDQPAYTTIDENECKSPGRGSKNTSRRPTVASLHFTKQNEADKKLSISFSVASLNSNPTRGVKEILLDTDSSKNLPLHLAIENNNLELAKLCIEEGKKAGECEMIQARRVHDDTCLHLAVQSSNLDMMKLLLSENADVNSQNVFNVTPLMIACQHNAYEVVTFLLQNGANLEMKNSDYLTPLMIACRFGHYETIQCLLDSGANATETDKDDKTCLMFAAEENRTEALTLLLSNQTISDLIQEKDKFNNTALHLASMRGHQETVKLLIEHEASVDNKNDDDRTTLHVAAFYGHETVIPDLIDRDRSILNAGDEESNTALHLAAIGGNLKSVTALVKRGANLEIRNGNQLTPLGCAAFHGWEKIVLALLESGANIEPKGKIKVSPLHLACQQGHVDVLKIFLQWKGDVTFRSADGRNALDFAIDFGQKECAITLVKHETWLKSLRNAIVNPVTGQMITPMRKLIMKMEDVAVVVCNQCLADNGKKPETDDYQVTMSYELIDDMYASTKWLAPTTDGMGTPIEPTPEENHYKVYDENDQLTIEAHAYTEEADILQKNHPLHLMVSYECEKLLLHPVVTGLLNYKWRHIGRYVYYTNLLLFVAYLIILNVYMLLIPPFYRLDWFKIIEFRRFLNNNRSAAGINITAANVNEFSTDSARCWYYRDHVLTDRAFANIALQGCNTLGSSMVVLKWVLFGFTIFLLLREFLQFLNRKRNHFGASNVIELTLYAFTLLITLDFRQYPIPKLRQLTAGRISVLDDDLIMVDFQLDTGLRQEWQEQIGAFSLFLSWIVLLLFIRKFPRLGIFVVMFTDILKTFSQFFIVFVLFIFAFTFSFTILLGNQLEFEHWYESFVKTTVMMIGELDYGDMFFSAPEAIDQIGQDYHSQVYAREVTMVLFVIFLLVMTIILMNLLVGLAVGDIMVVQENATLKRFGMQVGLALEVEFTLPIFLRKKICKRTHRIDFYKERNMNLFRKFFFASGLSLELLSKTLEENQRDQNNTGSAEDKVLSGLTLLRGRLSDVLAEQSELRQDLRGVRNLVRETKLSTHKQAKELTVNINAATTTMSNTIDNARLGLAEKTQAESNQTRDKINGTHRIVNKLQDELDETQGQINSVQSQLQDKIGDLDNKINTVETTLTGKMEEMHQTILSRNIEELDSKIEDCRKQVNEAKQDIMKAVKDLRTLLSSSSGRR